MKPSPYIADQLRSSGRFAALDGLRGVAVLAVVIYHFGLPFNTYYPSDERSPYSFNIGELGVQLFFMISGFVILLSAVHGKTAKNFIISRVSRLYPAYWSAVLVSALLIVSIGIETRSVSLGQVLLNLTMFQRFFLVDNVDQVYWTLAVELQFYFLMLACLLLSRGKLRSDYLLNFGLLWSSVGLVLMAAFPGDSSTGLAKMLVWAVLAQHAPFFCFGMSVFLYFNVRKFSWYIPAFGAIAVANTYLAHSAQYALGVLVLALVFFWVAHVGSVAILERGPLQFLGKISYSLYLFHTVLGLIFIHLTLPFLGNWWSRIFAFVLVVVIAWVSYQIFEKRLSKRFKEFLQGKNRAVRTGRRFSS